MIDLDKYQKMSKDNKSIFDLFFKEPLIENKNYLNIIIELVRIFEELQAKIAILKPTIEQMFFGQMAFRFMEIETIVLGFYYMFIYKDFVIREIVFKFSGTV